MSTPSPAGDPAARISIEQVRHVADLARLAMSDEELESCRGELASILDHIATIDAVDVDGVTPLAHAIDMYQTYSHQRGSGLFSSLIPSQECPVVSTPEYWSMSLVSSVI